MSKKQEPPRLTDQDLEEIRKFADQQDHDSGPHRPEIALMACVVLLLHELVVQGRR